MRRILALDGGGIKGVFPASFLASVEETIQDKIASYFDLIVGTSTGGIIALGLGLGWSAADILSFYERLGPTVFRRRPFDGLRQWSFSKYANVALKAALESQFGDKRIGESSTRLVIPSTTLETGKPYIYKTAHHERFERDYRKTAVEAALATAAAPTYFPTYQTANGIPLVDGGVWANNPTGLAVVEAIGVLGWTSDDIRVLNLGCTTEALDVGWARHRALGRAYWAGKVVDVFMKAQAFGSLGTAAVLIGHDSIVQINPHVPKGRFGLDGIKEIPSLKGLGEFEARDALPRLRKLGFFDSHVEPFTPFHVLSPRVGATSS